MRELDDTETSASAILRIVNLLKKNEDYLQGVPKQISFKNTI